MTEVPDRFLCINKRLPWQYDNVKRIAAFLIPFGSPYASYAVRFQVLTAANMKMTVFWNFASRSPVEIDRRFDHRPDNGDSKHI
jgi:hypothetical protein